MTIHRPLFCTSLPTSTHSKASRLARPTGTRIALGLGLALSSTAGYTAQEPSPLPFGAAPADTLLRSGMQLQQTVFPAGAEVRQFLHNSRNTPDRLSIYTQYIDHHLDQNHHGETPRYQQQESINFVGVEYQHNAAWRSGLRYTHLDQALDFQGSSNRLRHASNSAALYTQWYKNGFTATVLAGSGQGRLHLERSRLDGLNSTTPPSASPPIIAKVDTQQHFFTLEGRQVFRDGAWFYGPISRFNFSDATISSYDEASRDNGNEGNTESLLHYNARETRSRTLSMGVHAAYLVTENAFNNAGTTLTPFITYLAYKEFSETRPPLRATENTYGTNTTLQQRLPSVDERWQEISGGLTLQIKHQLTLTGSFSRSLHLRQQHEKTAAIRLEWFFP
ncbi:Hypothetical protein HDN1F_27820 [gamma proteobacterium HdN1]|nr:Hypothetical protein HDN1F_27820 [gamma proteobacterium HdN1]